ncbi:MAG: DUF4249 domain-containing protein [Saprospiraceae bacterium]|nr:DUF4249 domain-containing protein [Saprospiraceae bacterium]
MKSWKQILIFGLGLLGMQACIDPLDIQPEIAQRVLVVEGGISTAPGPHTILISKSAQYGSRAVDEVKLETGLTGWVRDEDGNQVFLIEQKPGTFHTPTGWKAEVGKSYTLFITLENGERFASLPEKIVPVPPVSEYLTLFKEQPAVNQFVQSVGIEIFARWQDPEEDNFYIWDTQGEYKIITYPENHIGRDFFGNPFPAPLDCCKTCYVKEDQVNRQLRIFKDNFTNGNEQTELIAYIEDDGGRFSENYMAVIDHASLTKEAFQFYDVLKNQLSISGDIFDPPTATIRGNMINLDEPESPTIGWFRGSDVYRDTIFINRSVLSNPAPPRVINDDCRVLNNSTTQLPPYWPG